MRVQLTVRRGTGEREVVVECDPATLVAELAPMLCDDHDHEHGDCTCRLWVAGRAVSPHALVGMPPLLAGAVVFVGEGDAARPGRPGRSPGSCASTRDPTWGWCSLWAGAPPWSDEPPEPTSA